jgi:hypothetical protein
MAVDPFDWCLRKTRSMVSPCVGRWLGELPTAAASCVRSWSTFGPVTVRAGVSKQASYSGAPVRAKVLANASAQSAGIGGWSPFPPQGRRVLQSLQRLRVSNGACAAGAARSVGALEGAVRDTAYCQRRDAP